MTRSTPLEMRAGWIATWLLVPRTVLKAWLWSHRTLLVFPGGSFVSVPKAGSCSNLSTLSPWWEHLIFSCIVALSLRTLTLQVSLWKTRNALSLWPPRFTIFLSTHHPSPLRTLFNTIVQSAWMWQAVDTNLLQYYFSPLRLIVVLGVFKGWTG